MTTILKLHSNGDFETLVPLTQTNVTNNYKFGESSIAVPKIIEYPPVGYRNYFIEKTSESGWIDSGSGTLMPADEGDRTSDFIDVVDWQVVTVIIRFKEMNGDYSTWVSISSSDAEKRFLGMLFYDVATPSKSGDFVWQFQAPISTAYIRVTTTYYDTDGVDVKISVEKDSQVHLKHYLAFEDMPNWVTDAGQPISIFPQGIVIKGDLITS